MSSIFEYLQYHQHQYFYNQPKDQTHIHIILIASYYQLKFF